jgi:hypothetical protein
MIGNRIKKLERFFGVKQPKGMSVLEWFEKLYDMEMAWEEEHQQAFPF